MNLEEFSKKNRERCESPNGFNHQLDSWSLSDWMTAITGEIGEAANIVKKLNRVRDGIHGNKETPEELQAKLAQELADVFVYLDLMFQRIGVDFGDKVAEVFNKKSEQIGCSIRV